jgi:hypothetical protein
VANGTLDTELLDFIGYRPALVRHGSPLEMVFILFTSALGIHEPGRVTNHDVAQRRAARWIRHCCDPSYEFDPLFQLWETELTGPWPADITHGDEQTDRPAGRGSALQRMISKYLQERRKPHPRCSGMGPLTCIYTCGP